MRTVMILKGLQASGKSTYAKQLLTREPGVWKRSNKDDLRALLDNGVWSGPNEKFVLKVRDAIITEALDSGLNCLIDDTNLAQRHETRIRQLVQNWLTYNPGQQAQVVVKFFDVPLEECIARDGQRTNPVGEKVIRQTYEQFLKDKSGPTAASEKAAPVRQKHRREKPEAPPLVEGAPTAIIADLDGTLADFGDRNPYDASTCETDKPNLAVLWIVQQAAKNGRKVLLMSGRDGKFKEPTERWLKAVGVPYDHLWMRTTGDNRQDSIVKKELYEVNILDKFNVEFVIDDRLQVCSMWYKLGISLFRFGDPDANF